MFTRADFVETRDGRCRVLPPLTHELAATMPTWAEAIAPHAEAVTHHLAGTAGGVIRRRKPLTGKPKTSPLRAAAKAQAVRPDPRCPDCGTVLTDTRRLRCPTCRLSQRASLAAERAAQAAARLTELQQATPKPAGAVMRAAKVSAQRTAAATWEADNRTSLRIRSTSLTAILPGLQPVPIASIQAAIDVGHDAAWRIREGTLIPHRRHCEDLTSSVPDQAWSTRDNVRPPQRTTASRLRWPRRVRGAASGTALAALDALRVAGRGPMTGYARALFGPAWTDTDRNGCDTRNDILRRDLTNKTLQGGHGRVRGAHRHPARPVQRHDDQLRPRHDHQHGGADRPRRRARQRLGHRGGAVAVREADRLRQRPAQPARGQGQPQRAEGRR